MITLPKVETLKPKSQPHNFFIWGATMSGKSYFASFFPNPLVLNTDGNSEQGSAPSIQIRNERGKDGKLRQSAIKQIDDVILALQNQDKTKPQFETLVVDVIDDICVMFEQAICIDNGVQSLADIGYGKGYAMLNSTLQQFVMDLKALPMNIIYISRELSITDDKTNVTTYVPSLKTKYYNIVNGNCDLVIRTQRLKGDNFYRSIEAKRTDYKPENITNHRVLTLLEKIPGMFPTEQKKESK
ncbi:AAA family ATPase [Lactobacillus sp. ESL0731]|uniref:AAA family ATPase n=1 Tax=unclassified Lactobacillus TaxID=2620435 RepID=UPI0023F8728B|nr:MULTISPECIES: AAA family ATPase [unclassified Lactobacillus]WEV51648.1 AAA family ATPase [Lactobacillus sp. ESL0700]WEV62777.1 AAA family ATPase [Lactobacillus sp. ESL0731]